MDGIEYLESLPKWTGAETFDLAKIEAITRKLENPQDLIPSIHIAGTNGKGSTSVSIASILGAAGYKTGLNTSPHLERINERFVVNGEELGESTISTALLEVRAAAQLADLTPSFHEALTAAAFVLFKKLDWAVYEVGLGGRLDASNVLSNPKVSVITSIGLDHQKILGNTIEQIAREKAGIIKQRSQVVIGKICDTAFYEIQKIAAQNSAPIVRYGQDFTVTRRSDSSYCYKDPSREFIFTTCLSGSHQLSNLGCAIKSALLVGVSSAACISGLRNVFWPGRMEQFEYRDKSFTLDCAHNIDGIRALIENTKDNRANQLIILGFLQRPDWQDILTEVASIWRQAIVLTPPTERAIASSEVAAFLSCNKVNVLDFGANYQGALEAACNSTQREILIAGSIYLVGIVRGLFNPARRPLWKMQKKP